MKAITLWQPWASFVAWGWKTIETRGHRMFASLVGERIAIHAGKKWDERAVLVAEPYLTFVQRQLVNIMMGQYQRGNQPRGCIVATAHVCGCRPMGPDDARAALCPSGPGRIAYRLKNVRALATPIPCIGLQGMWNVPQSIENQIRLQRGDDGTRP